MNGIQLALTMRKGISALGRKIRDTAYTVVNRRVAPPSRRLSGRRPSPPQRPANSERPTPTTNDQQQPANA